MTMDEGQREIEVWGKVAGAAVAFLVCAGLVVMSVHGVRQRAELARQSDSPAAQGKIDPLLIRYREVRRAEIGLHEARSIAVGSDGSLYAAGDSSVIRFNAAGEQQEIRPQDAPPYCLAVAEDGMVLVGARGAVSVFTKGGKFAARWTVPGKQAYLTSLAATGNDVWAADAGGRVVYHYDRSGRLLGRIGEKDAKRGIPGLVSPSPYLDVAVAKDGTVWVANPGHHQLEHYTKDGRLLSAWGKAGMAIEGFSGCCNPANIALLPDGRIVTAEKSLRRVKVYRADGTFDCVVAGPDAFSAGNGALDVAVDGQGRVYVLDRADGTVHVFTKK
jgi:DNA-binding beta-propeller fold protein YncE